jgi:hypothetical protein
MALLFGRRPIAALECRLSAEAASEKRRSGSSSTGLPTSPPKFDATSAPEKARVYEKGSCQGVELENGNIKGESLSDAVPDCERQYHREQAADKLSAATVQCCLSGPTSCPEQ